MTYAAPLRDIAFVLHDVLAVQDSRVPGYASQVMACRSQHHQYHHHAHARGTGDGLRAC